MQPSCFRRHATGPAAAAAAHASVSGQPMARPPRRTSREIRPAASAPGRRPGFDPDPDCRPCSHPAYSEETDGRIGPAEAAALSAPEDDLTLDAPPADMSCRRPPPAALPRAGANSSPQPVASRRRVQRPRWTT